MSQQKHTFFPTALDFDTILDLVGNPGAESFDGAYVDAWHVHLYPGKFGKGNAFRKMGGTVDIPWNAPLTGVNEGMGAFWDERHNTLICFVKNDVGGDSLIWHKPTQGTTSTIPMPNAVRGRVTGCVFVNSELLIWTDGVSYPKCINLSRADDTEKKSIVRMYLPPTTGVVDSRVLAVQLTLDGVPQGFAIPLAPANNQQLWDFQPQFSHFAGEFNGNTSLAAAFTARSCAEFLEFEATQAGMWSLTGIVTDTINGVPQASIPAIVEYWNRYNNPFTDEQIRLARIVPSIVPTAILGYDSSRSTSLIESRVFQFQVAYRLKDKEKTLTGAISDIALPAVTQCQNYTGQYNCIDIGFDDPWLSDPAMRGEIEFIDLFVRDHNDGSWFKFRTLEKYEWVYSRTFRFFNDGTYTASDQAYNEAGNTYVPPIANALEALVDADDNTRIVLGGITEGDDNPCVEVVLSPKIEAISANALPPARVRFEIRINNAFDQSLPQWYNVNQTIGVYDESVGPTFGGMFLATIGHTNDPETWGQKLPLGGFVVYAAGTDKIGISKQVVPVVTYGGGQTNSPTLWNAPTGSQAAGRNVYDLTQAGTSIFPWNRTHRGAARNAIEDFAVYSEVFIEGLIPGETYVFRVASNLCESLGGAGGIYDIDAIDRAYQRTSTYTTGVGTITAANIKPGPYECTVTIPLASAGQTLDLGEIFIADTTNPQPLEGSYVLAGYLFDALGTDNGAVDIRTYGVTADSQGVATGLFNLTGDPIPFSGVLPSYVPNVTFEKAFFGDSISDHNGFWFHWQSNTYLGAHPRSAWIGITGNPGAPAGIFNSFTAAGVNVTGYAIMNDLNDSKWEGDLTGVLTSAPSNNLFYGPGVKRYVFANLNSGTFMRTHIRTKFVTPTGSPVGGVVAVLEGGRVVASSTDGTIDLIAHGDVETNNNDRIADRLILKSAGPCNISFAGGDVRAILINSYQAGFPYSESPNTAPYPNHYNIADIIASVSGGLARGFGRGSSSGVGYYLGRSNGDRTAVKMIDEVAFPTLNADLHDWLPLTYPAGTFQNGRGVIEWALPTSVPIPWIGRWDFLQFVCTWDNSRVFMIQWLASQVVYSSIWNSATSEPTDVSYSSGSASEIYIALTDSFVRYGQIHSDAVAAFGTTVTNNPGYLWESGDMLRILTNRNRQPIFGNVVEVKITGQRGRYITIQATGVIPELFGGEVIEIFRPRKPTEDSVLTFYDLPDGRVKINDPNGNPTWSSVAGILGNGQSWFIPRQVPIRPSTTLVPTNPWTSANYTFESIWISDFYSSTDWGKGKPWFQDPDAATKKYGMLMRYTDVYIPNTNTNGLNFCGGFNVKITENWLGEIKRLFSMQESFVVPCTNGTFAIYKGVQQLRETAESLTQVSGGVLANIRPMAHHYGTQDPQAVIQTATTLLGFDRLKGVLWQWASNQLQPISIQRKVASYFMRKSEGMPPDGLSVAGWDQGNNEVLFSFPDVTFTEIGDDGLPLSVKEVAETIQYYDPKNAFISRMAYSPDFWGHTSLQLYSFKDGQLWRHEALFDKNSLNVIAGVQREASVDIPLSGDPTVVKDLETIWWGNGPGWEVPNVINNMGQVSRITQSESREGNIYKGTVIGNTDSQQWGGGVMKGTWYVVKFAHPGSEPCSLVWVRIGEIPSADSDMNAAGQ